MAARFIPLIQQTLDIKYPQKHHQEQLTLQNIRFKLFLPKTTLMITAYRDLKNLSINHCDIRNLENFPKLPNLQELDLGFNQIQGTFNHLIPLKRLKYLNVEDNIVFQSIKFAPLKKIASANRSTHQSTTNSLKISICLRNNPFANEEYSFINKMRGYGLKVIKEPKEYFDKKKTDQDKANKSAKKSQLSSGQRKSKKIENKKDKKIKKQQHEELDSFYSGQSIISEPSSSSYSDDDDDDDNNNNNNNTNPNRSIMMNNDLSRPYHRVSHRMDLENSIRPRMAVRLSQQPNLNIRDVIDNPFLESQDLGNQNGLVLVDYESDDSQEINVDRFGADQEVNQRLRVLEQRRARLQELRGMRREITIERERERLERLRDLERERRDQLLRQRHARQLELVRQLEEERQRLIRPSMLIRDNSQTTNIFGVMRNNSNNSNPLDDDWRINPFRRRPSGAIGTGQAAHINNDNVGGTGSALNIGGLLQRSESSNSINRYLNQMRNLQRHSSRNSHDSSMISPIYQPLRVRQSSQFPIIRLSRMQSYHSQSSNANANERQNQINRESQGIRFEMNDSVSDDDEMDNDDENDENQLNDDDDDEMDQMIQDDDNDDDDEDGDEMIHACNQGCEHNAGQQDDDDDQDDQQDQDDEQDEPQANLDEEQQSQNNNLDQFDFPVMQANNIDFDDFMMINDELIHMESNNDWRANIQLGDPMMRIALRNSRDGNPSLSSNQNPDSESNLDQGDDNDNDEGEL